MKGFSLLETVVAIAILTLAMLGPLALASFPLSRASLSENEIVAYNLAEEALEFMVNKRDSRVFAGQNWDSDFTPCQNVNGCYVDVSNDVVTACSANCPVIMRDPATGVYNYTSGPATIFNRTVFIDDNHLDNRDE